MRLFFFLSLQLRQHLLRKRWGLLLPVMLFIAYRSVNAIKGLLALHPNTSANLWDVLFIAFGNGWNIFLIITNLLLFLVSDLLPETGFGQLALLRLGSRRVWWLAKCLTLLITILAYTLLTVGLVLAFAAWSFPLEWDWSSLALSAPDAINIPLFVPNNTPILTVIGQILLLLLLGWYALGLLMMVITQLSHRVLVGYLAGLLILFSSFAVSWSGNLPVWTKLFIYKHLMFNHYPYPFRDVLVTQSIFYWFIWLVILPASGFILSKRQDYLALRH